ncbi:ABC-three component system protein [Pseudonocardia sp. MH-G8]|uniref:ABC-three component system protein n=1 Tax=Pseudonocardia sp. MH-G8 TaxID=1854588 RepID=UPI00117BBCD4|nr:ABC-three component system protein [Pseudonocardia sp. MH-G8]
MVLLLPSANWKDWYHAKHSERSLKTGSEFEAYFEELMTSHYDDYVNPAPAGSLGDGGCDGARSMGKTIYACYGSRARDGGERALARKLNSDFIRALSEWPEMTTWTFVTNAPFGPEALRALHLIQQDHKVGQARPIRALTWSVQKLWNEVVSRLAAEDLDRIFPGVPGSQDITLEDVLPLLGSLSADDTVLDAGMEALREVEPTKLDYNRIPLDTRVELNSGRRMNPAIARWFDENSDPELQDKVARNLTQIYQSHAAVTTIPKEVIERLYISIGGGNVRVETRRAECVFAIASYFFDQCHIFEEPPPGWSGHESHSEHSVQGRQ